MITHIPAGVVLQRTTVVSSDEEAAETADCLVDALSNAG
jgi:hypothetical protein